MLKLPALRRWQRLTLEGLAFLAAMFCVQAWQTREVPRAAPPLEGRLAGGGSASLAEFLRQSGGRPVLVYVWSAWCSVCKIEEATIEAIGRDWPVLGVAMQSGDVDEVARHMRARGLKNPALVDLDGVQSWRYGVRGVPAFFVVDGSGAIRFAGAGYTTGWGLRARLWWAEAFPA